MPSPDSLRRLANLTKKVRDDLRKGGMGVNFRYLFRSTAILARVVELLADHVATQAELAEAEELEGAPQLGSGESGSGESGSGESGNDDASPAQERGTSYGRERAEETA